MTKVTNPETGRQITVGGKIYNQLVRKGIIKDRKTPQVLTPETPAKLNFEMIKDVTPIQQPVFTPVHSLVDTDLIKAVLELQDARKRVDVDNIVKQEEERRKNAMEENQLADSVQVNPVSTPVVRIQPTTQIVPSIPPFDPDTYSTTSSLNSGVSVDVDRRREFGIEPEVSQMGQSPPIPHFDQDDYSLQSSIETGATPDSDRRQEFGIGSEVSPVLEAVNPQEAAQTFASDSTSLIKKPKYHINSILFYFGPDLDYDPELLKNVYSSDMSKEEIIKGIDSIIANYGSILFAYERKSESIDEFHELIQLQFCYLRNLMRGPRVKMAAMQVSDIVNFQNSLGSQQEQVDPFVEANNLDQTIPQDTVNATQVQIPENELIDKIYKEYQNSPTDVYGKPVVDVDAANISLIKPSIGGYKEDFAIRIINKRKNVRYL